MKINEVVKITGLTKKAIYYYEQEGLLSPKKEAENGYRTFSEDDISRLLEISVLRKLDMPLSIIKQVIENPNVLIDVMIAQLAIIGKRIKSLSKNQEMIKDLISKVNLSDPTSTMDEFRNLNEQLFLSSRINPGYMQHELERVFPGLLGKILFVKYGQFLDAALDNNEKIKAWNELVNKLDALEETHYTEQVEQAIDQLYGNLKDQAMMDTVSDKSRYFVDGLISGEINPSKEELLEALKRLKESGKMNDLQIFDEFMVSYKYIFEDLNKYMMVLSRRFKELNDCENSLKEKMRGMGLLKEKFFSTET